jgi:hypothetical protein
LFIQLQVRHGRPIHTNVVVVAEVEEFTVNWVPLSVMIVLGLPKR